MERVFDKFPWVIRTPLPELGYDRDRVKEIVLEEFTRWEKPTGQYSFKLASQDDFFRKLYDRFAFECLRTFQPFTLHKTSSNAVWAYVQDDRHGSPVWHDHILTSTINAVYYLAAPEGSGELHFRYRDEEMKTTPQEGCIYLFPRWLLHRPMPQASPDTRVSLNLEMITNECPIAKDGNWRW